MSLKELTAEKHKQAETHPFIKILFSGRIDPTFYATFLHNQYLMYLELETLAIQYGVLDGIYDIRRAYYQKIDKDELWISNNTIPVLPVVSEYINHLYTLDPDLLLAHLYVRHMGDLYGGQMIAKKVPGSGTMYKFDNIDDLKQNLRAKLSDNLADEANVCFDFALKTFDEMMKLDMNKLMDPINE